MRGDETVNKRITNVNKAKKLGVYKSTTKVNDKKATAYKSNTKVNKEKPPVVNKRITDVNKAEKLDVYKSTTKVNDKKATVSKEKVCKLTTKVNEEKHPAVNKSNTDVNKLNEMVVYKDITKVSTKVKTDILEVAALKSKIQEVIEWYETKHKNVIETPELKMDKKHFTGEIVVKSYRLHSDIVKKFDSFTNKHNQYKMQDLIGQALLEFIEKYY